MNRPAAIPMAVLETAAGVLRVLAHPHRLRIIELLEHGRMNVGDLAAELGLPQAAVSQHLNHMKAHRLLDCDRRGRQAYYRIANPHATNVLHCIRRHGDGAHTVSADGDRI